MNPVLRAKYGQDICDLPRLHPGWARTIAAMCHPLLLSLEKIPNPRITRACTHARRHTHKHTPALLELGFLIQQGRRAGSRAALEGWKSPPFAP